MESKRSALADDLGPEDTYVHVAYPTSNPVDVSPSSVTPAISLRSVTKEFSRGAERQLVLSGVSLTVAPGEFVALVGRSGCGKTTVLNIASGMLAPDGGEVEVFGGHPDDAIQQMAYMPARDALMPWRTARRNVELALELRGTPRSERRERALEMLGRVHLGDSGDKFPWQLSQGMRQRVSLARAWVTRPNLILMDEPFSALDAQTRILVQEEFLEMWSARNPSVLLVTHDLSEALLLADRVVMLDRGTVILDLPVPLPRPRHALETPQLPEFQRLFKDLWSQLGENSRAGEVGGAE